MQDAMQDLSKAPGLWAPLSARAVLFLVTVLGVCGIGIDLAIYGPVTHLAAQVLVVGPVEAAWGFHAEYKRYRSQRLLSVVTVTPGGAFDRAGIRAGFAFPPRTCGTGGAWFGDQHSLLAGGERSKTILLLTTPEESPEWKTFVITRE